MKSKLSISKLFMRLEPGCTIQQAFARLSKPSHTTITLTEEDMLKLFGCEASSSSLADARCTYFKSLNTQDLNKSLRHLAPSESLLMTKILRSIPGCSPYLGHAMYWTTKILIPLSMDGLLEDLLSTWLQTWLTKSKS